MGPNLYDGKWRKARNIFLRQYPLCKMCTDEGFVAAASVIDHTIPHRGNLRLFWDQNNWQPLCRNHHNQRKQREEKLGYALEVGGDGWPLDPRHPGNRR